LIKDTSGFSEKIGRLNNTANASDVTNEDGLAIIDNLSFLTVALIIHCRELFLKALHAVSMSWVRNFLYVGYALQ
jgi:hypothetical protein